MSPNVQITITPADTQASDQETGGELLRLRRTVAALQRTVRELVAEREHHKANAAALETEVESLKRQIPEPPAAPAPAEPTPLARASRRRPARAAGDGGG